MHRCFTLCQAYSRWLSLASGRSRGWRRDPYLPTADTLALTAYRGASADWQALNYLSNITPQAANLNQGAWARLEDKERALALSSDVAVVWSVTGPLFERHIATLLAAPEVVLPSGYWKIIFIGSSPDKGEYAAFLLDQATPKSASFCDYQVTVDEIERRTHPGLSLWSALPAGIARRLKSRKGSLAIEMGGP